MLISIHSMLQWKHQKLRNQHREAYDESAIEVDLSTCEELMAIYETITQLANQSMSAMSSIMSQIPGSPMERNSMRGSAPVAFSVADSMPTTPYQRKDMPSPFRSMAKCSACGPTMEAFKLRRLH